MILDTWFQCFIQSGGNVVLDMTQDSGDTSVQFAGDLTTALAQVVTDDNKIRTMVSS